MNHDVGAPVAFAPPNASVLALLCALSDATSDPAAHRAALEARDRAATESVRSYADLCLGLARALAVPSLSEESLGGLGPAAASRLSRDPSAWACRDRVLAGLSLRRLLERPPPGPAALSDAVAAETRAVLERTIRDPHPGARNAACGCAAAAARGALPLAGWPDLLPSLIRDVGSSSTAASAGALATLRRLTEDDDGGRRCPALAAAGEALVPALLARVAADDADPTCRAAEEALACLRWAVPTTATTTALATRSDEYLGALSALSTRAAPSAGAAVCRELTYVLTERPEWLRLRAASVADFLVAAVSRGQDQPETALRAAEFWLACADAPEESATTTLRVAWPRLVPALLRNMVHPSDKIRELVAENEAEARDDHRRREAAAPIFHRPRGGRDDDDDEDDDHEWTLRKCCAAALDAASHALGPRVTFEPLLPLLQQGLAQTEDPWAREASLLALGAAARCGAHLSPDPMEAHLPALHPFLVGQARDGELPQLRSIACWTLGRFADWVVQHRLEATAETLLAVVDGDRYDKVVYAAASAFAVVVEASGELDPDDNPLATRHVGPVHDVIARALGRRRPDDVKGTAALLDALGVAAEALGGPAASPAILSVVVPALLGTWESLAPGDRLVVPTLEALASVTLNAGRDSQPWALRVYERCVATVETVLLETAAAAHDDNHVVPDEDLDPLVCAVDCVDALVEGLTDAVPALLASSARYDSHRFLAVLSALVGHEAPSVRLSAFALLGDLARRCPVVIEPGAPVLLDAASASLDDRENPAVRNNAAWAAGEMCASGVATRFLLCDDDEGRGALLAGRLTPLLFERRFVEDDAGAAANAAAALGRLARVDPRHVASARGASSLDRLLAPWCDALARVADPDERADGFEGLSRVLRARPDALAAAPTRLDPRRVSALVAAAASWYDDARSPPPPALGHELGRLLRSLRASCTDEGWRGLVADGTTAETRRVLASVWGIV